MSKYFNPDNPLMQFLTRIADLIILNLLFLFTSLTVVTIGASWTALYTVTLKMVRDEEGAIVRSYFHAFRQNFRQATLLWLAVLSLIVVMVLDMFILGRAFDSPVTLMRIPLEILVLLILMVLQYLFPYLAQFDASIKETVRNACLLALANLPKTAVMTIAAIGVVYLSCLNNLTISISIALWLLLGFALMSLGNSAILAKVFAPYLPKQPASELPDS